MEKKREKRHLDVESSDDAGVERRAQVVEGDVGVQHVVAHIRAQRLLSALLRASLAHHGPQLDCCDHQPPRHGAPQ